jgi:hypothetical protein
MCDECYPPSMQEMAEALRKAIAWGEGASNHILYCENINWRYLDEARETYGRYCEHTQTEKQNDTIRTRSL